jgi:hypothetical protein
MSTTYAQPGVAPATDALLQEILLELRTLNRRLEVRDTEPVFDDGVLNKSGLETSLLALAEGTIPEGGRLKSGGGKEESETEIKLEGQELVLGAETPPNSEAKGEKSKNVAQGTEAGTLDSENGKEGSGTGKKLEGPKLASGSEAPSSSEAKRETSENIAQGSEAGALDSGHGKEESDMDRKPEGPELALGAEITSSSEAGGEPSENGAVAQGSEAAVEMAHVDSAELVAQGAEDSAETGVKEEVEMLESPQCDGEVARDEGVVDGSGLEVVSHNSHQVEDNDIPESTDPIHRYHWDYPWSSASEEERTKQTAGYPVTDDVKEMWSNYIGCNWAIPPDRRVGPSFDSWTLRRDADHGKERLEKLTNNLRLLKNSKLGDSSFQITDYHYDNPPKNVQYFHQNDYRTAIVPEEILGRVNFRWKGDWERIWKARHGEG